MSTWYWPDALYIYISSPLILTTPCRMRTALPHLQIRQQELKEGELFIGRHRDLKQSQLKYH